MFSVATPARKRLLEHSVMAGACVCRRGGGEGESGTERPSKKKMSTLGLGARGGDSEPPAPGSG